MARECGLWSKKKAYLIAPHSLMTILELLVVSFEPALLVWVKDNLLLCWYFYERKQFCKHRSGFPLAHSCCFSTPKLKNYVKLASSLANLICERAKWFFQLDLIFILYVIFSSIKYTVLTCWPNGPIQYETVSYIAALKMLGSISEITI